MRQTQHIGNAGCAAVFSLLVLAGCTPESTGTRSFDTRSSEIQASEPEVLELEAEPSPELVAAIIDDYAGHPDDPQLPSGTVGASDDALAATNSREIAELLRDYVAFARERSDTPRFLFALGRAALFHGYERLGHELLSEAADKGSGGASAYLGLQAEADREYEIAREHLQTALARGFDATVVRETLAALADAGFDPGRFNRPDLIKALHEANFAALKQDMKVSWLYIGALHNTLWNDTILFLVDAPDILLELDPAVSAEAGFVSKKAEAPIEWAKSVDLARRWLQDNFQSGQSSEVLEIADEETRELAILLDQAVQDGRRLAMLYETAPGDFRKVYRGIRAFLEIQ